jgi:hypothetical protein
MSELGVWNHASVVTQQIRMQICKLTLGTVVRGALLACAALILSSSPAMAQAGKLDPAFGVGGVFTNSVGVLGTVAAVQSDGKIVVGGQIARRLLWYASMRTVPSTRLSGLVGQ